MCMLELSATVWGKVLSNVAETIVSNLFHLINYKKYKIIMSTSYIRIVSFCLSRFDQTVYRNK